MLKNKVNRIERISRASSNVFPYDSRFLYEAIAQIPPEIQDALNARQILLLAEKIHSLLKAAQK